MRIDLNKKKYSMKKSASCLLILIAALVFSGCSKEKRIERTLHKGDGSWSISSVTWQKVEQSTSGQTVDMGTSSDVGTFTFENDGSGSYNFTIDGDSYSRSFDWVVSDESISITEVIQSVDYLTGDVIQISVAFSGVRDNKNEITLEGSETMQTTSGTSVTQKVISGTFKLKRN